jgi:hypothetical protein
VSFSDQEPKKDGDISNPAQIYEVIDESLLFSFKEYFKQTTQLSPKEPGESQGFTGQVIERSHIPKGDVEVFLFLFSKKKDEGTCKESLAI